MLYPNEADGIHRVEDAHTNWYLLEAGDRLTIVDTGVPRSWDALHAALAALGRSADDVDAVVLTHAHFDHLGFAERARRTLGIPVWVHENDVPLTRHPRQYARERPLSFYLATQVRALPIAAALVRSRAWWPAPLGRSAASPAERCPCRARRGSCPRRATPSGTARCTSRTATR